MIRRYKTTKGEVPMNGITLIFFGKSGYKPRQYGFVVTDDEERARKIQILRPTLFVDCVDESISPRFLIAFDRYLSTVSTNHY
jgi:hypothetical protein